MNASRAFVGREDEIAALDAMFAAVLAETTRVLIVDGDAGIGKTTLVERFLSDRPAARVLRSSGDESETSMRFAVADQLLRAAGSPAVEVLRADQHLAVGMDLLEQLGATSGEHGTVVVVDDAHLADADSLRALLFCARRLRESATLFILVVRGSAPETLSTGWLKLADGAVVHPHPLTVDETRALGRELGVELTSGAAARLKQHTDGNPLYIRAVLRELPAGGAWLHNDRPLPVPREYAQLIEARVRRCSDEVITLLSAAAVLGVRAPLRLVARVADLADPLATVDDAVDTELIRVVSNDDGIWLAFTHPLTRAAVRDALSHGRRRALHSAAAAAVTSADATLHHRVEAATMPDDKLAADLASAAREQLARGGWATAVKYLLAASRVTPDPVERERFTLDAIEALMYAGDGGAARRLAEQVTLADSPRRDGMRAYLAMFAGDLSTAERLLERAWERRGGDPRLAATIAQRRAFLASSRLRGGEAIAWAQRAMALAADDPGTALLVAPSLANGLAFEGRLEEAHAALDRWLDDRAEPSPGSGFVLLALKARLLEAHGDLPNAVELFARAADVSLAEGLFVVAALSLAGLARVHYLGGAWDDAAVSAERAVAVAIESEDRWVIAHARWSASFVPAARGDWPSAGALQRDVAADRATFERHTSLQALVAAQFAAAQDEPTEVLAALSPLAEQRADYTVLPWHHLQAHALVDAGRIEDAAAFIAGAQTMAAARRYPLLTARLHHAGARLALARRDPSAAAKSYAQARETVEPLGMPFEQSLIDVAHAQFLRREGKRRAASALLLDARDRLTALSALPALRRCERELTACGLTPVARSGADHPRLTPQETAVARLVVSGMTNREVAKELMLSTKTVEFHLSHVYLKFGVRSRTELRVRARGNALDL